MNSQLELMKKAIDDASREKGIQWNKVTWYSWVLALVVFFGVLPASAFYLGMEYGALRIERGESPSVIGGDFHACTEEAKLCPDGSSVSRSGPNCDFAPCPGTNTPVAPTPGVKKPKTPATKPVACTMDARMCPDGSAVGRSGPNCEFEKCSSLSGRPELHGVATMGPVCPVVQNPPDPACADKPYEGSLEVWTTGGGFIKSFATKKDGSFSFELTPGVYILRRSKSDSYFPTLSPTTFTMEQAKITDIAVTLDTGIR